MITTPKKFTIGLFDCDLHKRLRVSRLCEFFQEAALAHLRDQGFDYFAMIDKDRFTLMLSRIKLRISKLPFWGEDIFISAWLKSYNPEKVAWCDYDVRDSQGNSVVQATSSWLLIDLKDCNAIPFSAGPYRFKLTPELSALPESIELLEPSGMPKTVLVKNVKYSDLDLNNHVNNCRYSDWVLDAISMEEIKRIRSIQLNYMLQVEYDTKVALMRFPHSRHHVVIFGVNEEHPEEVHFQARIGFDKPLLT
ncbi:MAG: thioesterase [Fibromonadales bacterium]|nr:thioesterase [Fibromonadales bacterium]MCL2207615.1 thioesterase [Fibromonadales bacterium]